MQHVHALLKQAFANYFGPGQFHDSLSPRLDEITTNKNYTDNNSGSNKNPAPWKGRALSPAVPPFFPGVPKYRAASVAIQTT